MSISITGMGTGRRILRSRRFEQVAPRGKYADMFRPGAYMRFLSVAALAAYLLVSPDAFGQRLSFGVVGGASLTDDFRSAAIGAFPTGDGGFESVVLRFYSTSKDFIVGPMMEGARRRSSGSRGSGV